MNSTLYNGRSGILTHQVGLDSTSNNIANVNTIGYRANMARFETIFARSMNHINTSSPINNDFGYGVTVSSNAISTKSGSYKNSEGDFDIAYSGKGWFVTGTHKDGKYDLANPPLGIPQKNYFTRDGGFNRDAEGYLVNSDGFYLYGIDLGKISEKGVFTGIRNEKEDNIALSKSTLSPLRIPEDIYYQPTLTTKVGTTINLNKTNLGKGVDEVFKKPDGSFDLEAFLAQDVNALMDGEFALLEANNYKNLTLTTTVGGKSQTHTFVYGEEGENGFKSVGDLQKLIKEKTGLTLDIARNAKGEPDGCSLVLHNDGFSDMEITMGGKLAKRLGLSDAPAEFRSGASSRYNPNATSYDLGAYVNANGIVYQRIGAAGNSDPHTDATNWKRVDSSSVPAYSDKAPYEVGDIVEVEGNLYRRIGAAGNSDPAATPAEWENLGESLKGAPAAYAEGTSYPTNEVVSLNGNLYKRIGTEGASDPRADKLNWVKLANDSLITTKLAVPSYKGGVEIFSKDGTKYLLQSTYHLLDSGKQGEGERWEVRSAIFDHTGKTMISDSVLVHEMVFNGGVVSAPEVQIPFDGGTIAYNPAQSQEGKPSTNLTYVESQVKESQQDGAQAGRLQDVRVDSHGRIFLAFSNGRAEVMGRVGLAAFVNDQGLQKVGGNAFQMTSMSINGADPVAPSGHPILAWDEEGQLKFGQIMHKMLETSNVDIGSALTELIVMQRGYSFNAKAFTTGDELIKEAIGLKRS